MEVKTTLNEKEIESVKFEVDDAAYVIRNMSKLMDYEKNGLILGDNLILTIETLKRPLDIRIVEEKVRLFLV